MIVVDSNVVAYLLISGDQTAPARRALARDPAWAAPLLWRSELRNVLALYVRRGDLALADAQEVQVTAESLLAGREFAVDSADVLALAASSGRSAYDCEFVAVARRLGVGPGELPGRCDAVDELRGELATAAVGRHGHAEPRVGVGVPLA